MRQDRRKVKDAAYAFLSYMSAPGPVQRGRDAGKTGFNPYRTSQFTNLAAVAGRGHERDRPPTTTWAPSRTA